MVNKRISDDAKRIGLRLLARGRDTPEEIGKICRYSTRTLFRAKKRFRDTGSVRRARARNPGRPRLLNTADAHYLLQLAKHKPSIFLDEYTVYLEKHRHLPASISTVHRTFERAGLSVKRVQKMASERDPLQAGNFLHRVAAYPAHYLVSIDEMSKDDRTYARLWGRSPVGERVEEYSPFVRKRRFSALCAMALDKGIIASRVVEGSFDRDTFVDFLRNDLVSLFHTSGSHLTSIKLPIMNPYPAPQSVLLLDNARIHHSEEIRELVEAFGMLYPDCCFFAPLPISFRMQD
jgi:transposase